MARYDGPIVDVDVHHIWAKDADITKYLPKRWRDYVAGAPESGLASHNKSLPRSLKPRSHSPGIPTIGGHMTYRVPEAFAPDGTHRSPYEILKLKWLDPHHYYRCLLTHDVGQYGGHLNRYFAAPLCRAVNDWNIENWLTYDDRFYSVIVIPTGAPDEAAKEIRRIGHHPRMVGVVLAGNVLGRPFGDPVFHPIYKAAMDMGLQITLHYGSCDRPSTVTSVVGGPPVGPSAIRYSQFSQQAMHYVSSFIVNGVFEKFSDLRILVTEYGVAWLPYLMWRLDHVYPLLRQESPWVKRWPSEYIQGHVKVSTQPLEVSPDPRSLIQLLKTVDGIEDLLCFSTDWPHGTTDDPTYIARVLPGNWHRKVFYENACSFFNWPSPRSVTLPEHVVAATA